MHVLQALEIFLKVLSKLQASLRSNGFVVRALNTRPNKVSARQPQTVPLVRSRQATVPGSVS